MTDRPPGEESPADEPQADAATAAAAARDRLAAAGHSVAVAEGVTGGLVCARLTDVPGASAVLDRGWVPYGYDALRTELGVPRERLDEHGAVSGPVTRSLARRARDRADATWGLATTGVAGPNGGAPDRPVGTVHCAVAYAAPWESEASFVDAERRVFDGDRAAVRTAAAAWALERLAAAIEEVATGGGGDGSTDGGADGSSAPR